MPIPTRMRVDPQRPDDLHHRLAETLGALGVDSLGGSTNDASLPWITSAERAPACAAMAGHKILLHAGRLQEVAPALHSLRPPPCIWVQRGKDASLTRWEGRIERCSGHEIASGGSPSSTCGARWPDWASALPSISPVVAPAWVCAGSSRRAI